MRPATLLACAALIAGLAWLAQPGALVQIEARLGSHAESEAVQPGRAGAVDPTPYRDGIEAIEQVLYRDAPATWSDPETVSRTASALGERLYADLGPLRGRKALTDLVDFATSVDAQAESGFAAPELDAPRAAWEALRAEWFQSAPWFQRTTAQLVAAQRPPAPVASLLDLHELWKWAGSIETLVDAGRVEMERPSELQIDDAEASPAERDRVERWQSFARDWDGRVQGLGATAPRRPMANGEPNLVFAHQALEQALQQLALATNAEGDAPVPTKAWRAQCLDAAATHVAAAREFLARAHTGASIAQTASVPAAGPPR